MVEFNASNTDGNPGEQRGDGGQVLEPDKNRVGAGAGGHECEEPDGSRD